MILLECYFHIHIHVHLNLLNWRVIFLFIGKLFRLKIFSDDQGSWMIMFLASLISLFIFSWLYNALLLAGGSSTEDYMISGLMGLTNAIFMKMAACGTWCGDFFTAWMVNLYFLVEKIFRKCYIVLVKSFLVKVHF